MEGTSFRWRWRRWLLGCSVLAAAPGDSISAGAVRAVQAGPRRARQSSIWSPEGRTPRAHRCQQHPPQSLGSGSESAAVNCSCRAPSPWPGGRDDQSQIGPLKGKHHVRTVVNNIRHNHWARGLNLLLLIALAALPALGQAGETISLYEAMREGKVAAHFTATGSSSGDAINLTINKTPLAGYGTLTITVPPGLRLQNANGAWQSMVISGVRGRLGGNRFVRDPVIRLSDAVPSATYLLSVYSAEFHKDNPPPSSQFTQVSRNRR